MTRRGRGLRIRRRQRNGWREEWSRRRTNKKEVRPFEEQSRTLRILVVGDRLFRGGMRCCGWNHHHPRALVVDVRRMAMVVVVIVVRPVVVVVVVYVRGCGGVTAPHAGRAAGRRKKAFGRWEVPPASERSLRVWTNVRRERRRSGVQRPPRSRRPSWGGRERSFFSLCGLW